MFCRGCSLLAAAAFAAPAGARSIFVRVTSTPSNALSKLSGKVKQEGLDRKQKATKVSFLLPPLRCWMPVLRAGLVQPLLMQLGSGAAAFFHCPPLLAFSEAQQGMGAF